LTMIFSHAARGFFCRPESAAVAFGMSRWEAWFSLLVSG
jgi:hypothetical protein